MRKVVVWVTMLTLVLGVTVLAYGWAAQTARTDCPGTVVCPLTGEEVCKDQCPLLDAKRADCPGKIDCPLTGEPVCEDQCPLGEAAASTAKSSACCSADAE